MRRQHKHSTATNLLASKRIAVAFCAAVAMVLGAMSVGATMHFYPSEPTTISTQGNPSTAPVHANTTTFSSDSGFSISQAASTISTSPAFSQQAALTPILIAPPKNTKKSTPVSLLKVIPNIVSQTSLTLGPLSVSASVANNSVQLNTSLTPSIDIQVPTSLPNILPAQDNTSAPSSNDTASAPATTPPSDSTTDTSSNTTAPSSTPPSDQSLLSVLTAPLTNALQTSDPTTPATN